MQMIFAEELGHRLAVRRAEHREEIEHHEVLLARVEFRDARIEIGLCAGLGGCLGIGPRRDRAEDDRHRGILRPRLRDHRGDILLGLRGIGMRAQVVAANAEDDGARFEIEDIFAKAKEHAAAGVAADAAISDLQAGKALRERLPVARQRIADKHHRALIFLALRPEIFPVIDHPRERTDRPLARPRRFVLRVGIRRGAVGSMQDCREKSGEECRKQQGGSAMEIHGRGG